MRQVGGFLIFSTNKTDHHDIADILLKVVLNIITLQNQQTTLPDDRITPNGGALNLFETA